MEKKTFQQAKEKQLSMRDNSSIGKWDDKIIELCGRINKTDKYYTTSSCAGRAVLIKYVERKQEGLFLFRTHDKVKLNELKKEIEKAQETNRDDLIYFRQEPCILHVACSDLKSAQVLLDKAKLVGWKNSGIMASSNRIILEMRSTEHIELPIIFRGKLLVDDDYLKILVSEANKKLERTWEKIQKLEGLI